MFATISRYFDALKKRRSNDEGFSLIELIVVVAILGILIAIAIPVFSGIQGTAEDNSLKAVAANGANVVAADLAAGGDGTTADLGSLENADITDVSLVGTPTLDSICVKATGYNGKEMWGGNGALPDGTGCKSATP